MRLLTTALFLPLLAGCASVVRIDLARLPDKVEFTDLDEHREEKALKQVRYALDRVMFVPNMTELMSGPVTCGPFLWERIQAVPAAAEIISDDIDYIITVPAPDGTLDRVHRTGKRIFSATDKGIFCRILQQAVIGTSAVRIRKPEFAETQLLWKRAGGSMSEPYFILQTDSVLLIIDIEYTERAQAVQGEYRSYTGARLQYIDDYTGFRRFADQYVPAGVDSAAATPKFFPRSSNPLENRPPRPQT